MAVLKAWKLFSASFSFFEKLLFLHVILLHTQVGIFLLNGSNPIIQ